MEIIGSFIFINIQKREIYAADYQMKKLQVLLFQKGGHNNFGT